MSNHAGSYMLNDVLGMLHRAQVFDMLGREKSQQLLVEIVERACRYYDCNSGEILENYGAMFGLCASCLKQAEIFEFGLCKSCYGE